MKNTNTEREAQLMVELALNALNNPNSKFEFIRSWEIRKAVKLFKRGLKRIANNFKIVYKIMKSRALDEIKEGNSKFETIIEMQQYGKCWEYYKREIKNLNNMLNEHLEYVFSGHILDTFIFHRFRPDNECVDYRRIPGIFMFKKFK